MTLRRLLTALTCTALVLTAAHATPAHACIWDTDTLRAERQAFPSALELMTGKFLRHSEAYYQWRLKDRTARLAKTPGDLALMDDLAAAHDKLGAPERGVEIMREALKLKPGRYETHANLGTFLIHAGKLKEGLTHIDQALKINPDAHFGRERYQRYLVEYVLEQRAKGATLPIQYTPERRAKPDIYGGDDETHPNFVKWLALKPDLNGKNTYLDHTQRAAPIKGVLGMMRFGDHTSPILLEALGDLLATRHDIRGSGPLAARAYLLASERAKTPADQAAYRELATKALSTRKNLKLSEIEAQLTTERKDAQAWIDKVHADEAKWIAAGADVDAEFAKTYYKDGAPIEPEVVLTDSSFCGGCAVARPAAQPQLPTPWPLLALALGALVALRRRRS